jgi:predicted metal-dependent hydrolase
MDRTEAYDPRYLAGILLFNRGDFFEAHEVWEDLWMETTAPEKRFYQGLIQAAVALCHFCNGNLRGAVKLYHSSRDYMNRFGSPFLGLDVTGFWEKMAQCFATALTADPNTTRVEPDPEFIPVLTLTPGPDDWPDPDAFLSEDHKGGRP